ncbi:MULTISPECIES: PAS domain-containing protein [unclassified Corallococcus]|uniref:PAS domain-containing protein n=1 Tax=unclassified Corallococcus TaxID=2685029 RepID=UPI001A900735|nr:MULTISPECIES: PAS domain-containing protein [unclassified Corallococcus]MBN9681960.1 PAS domain-containing protein [Corallococcus sp. NCSPR001]WAS86475.1 PAS domain-containing protein [Corallococcus sp. NCRR]
MNIVANFIEANLDVLVRRFSEAARGLESTQGLKPSEVISTLPEYLHAVAAICRNGATPERLETRVRLEETHINLRLRVGATQEDATDEYTLLGRLIPQLWEDARPECKPDAADLQCLFHQIEESMDHVVVLFSGYSLEDRQREKRFLRQMDALAPRWLEPGADMQGPVKPLVELIVRAMEANGAELFLVDAGGRRMVPVAHTGHPVPPPGRSVDSRGPSFLGQVARSEEPRVLAQARGLEDATLDGLHVTGWSTLLGLRLWPHGDLMGVLCVGFTEARPVPPQTKRFLETLVEYLSGILDRALLMGQLRETTTRLEASESRYRLASQAAADTVWDWNLLTQEVAWSGETRSLLGFAPEETGPLASWWVERIHPEDRERVEHGIQAAIRGTQARWQDEYRFLNRQGGVVRVLDTGVILRDAAGRGVRMVGAMQDVTSQREEESGRARQLLEARSARVQADTALGHLHVLLKQAPVALAILRGPEHVVELANDRVCQLWGRPCEQVLERPVLEALPEVEGQGIRELLDGVLATGVPYVGHEVRVRLARAAGGALEDAHFNLIYQPLRAAEVGIEGILVVASEVTEAVRARHRAEGLAATLQASEERLRLALDAADMGSWDIDLTTGRGTWDARFRAMLGLPAQGEVTLDEAMRFVLEEDRPQVEQAMAEAARPGGSGEYACEFRARAPQGDPPVRWISGRGHVHFAPDGRPVRFVGTGLDATERKLAEEAARQRAEFEQYLMGIVSHDLRNPLNSIMLGTTSLLRREELNERATKAVLRIQASAERAVRMIRDLLDFTQARLGGGLPVQRQDLELGALVRQVVEEMRMTAPERDLQLSLPQAGLRGCWDPDRVTQLLINLMGNALKYSPEDTPVAVRLREVPGSVLLEVHNGGAPIASDVLTRIFQPMQRGAPGMDAATRSVGLGLYIVRTIVHAHGGTIDVTSTREAGTTFTVRLPHGCA